MELKRRAFELDLVAQYQAGCNKSFLLVLRDCTLYTYLHQIEKKS